MSAAKENQAPVLLFGGSFDPPHLGHVLVAAYLLSAHPKAKLHIIPCYKHAFDKKLSTFARRFKMCRLAFSFLGKRVHISDVERRHGGISRAIDTAQRFKTKYPKRQLLWVIGSDLVPETRRWYRYADLLKCITFLPLPRASKGRPKGKSGTLPFQFPAIASSEIRKRVKLKKDLSAFVPQPVASYIRAHKLYR